MRYILITFHLLISGHLFLITVKSHTSRLRYPIIPPKTFMMISSTSKQRPPLICIISIISVAMKESIKIETKLHLFLVNTIGTNNPKGTKSIIFATACDQQMFSNGTRFLIYPPIRNVYRLNFISANPVILSKTTMYEMKMAFLAICHLLEILFLKKIISTRKNNTETKTINVKTNNPA